MKACTSCGGPLVAGHPFEECPKCLFAAALSGVEAADSPVARFPGIPGLTFKEAFFNSYQLLDNKPVGGGGQGQVVKVWDSELRREIAMKRLAGPSLESDAEIYRFLAEAQITSQLEHPGILPVFDVGLDPDGVPYYTTQLVAGATLAVIWAEVRRPQKDWTVNRALALVPRICEIISHAHEKGVIHRDIKPSNILVGPFGDVRVIDWGSAHVIRKRPEGLEEPFVPMVRQTVQTDRGRALWADPDSPLATEYCGQPITIIYMPPEILEGRFGEVGPETDVYSVGVVLYELLTGRLPYSDENGELPKTNLREIILSGPPPPVRSVDPTVPRDLEAICHKAMARNKESRYPSMERLASDIRFFVTRYPVKARNPGRLMRARKWVARNMGYVALMAFIAVTLSAGYAVGLGLKADRDMAQQMSAMRNAERLARTGQWRDVLRSLDKAESFGYAQEVELGLRRVEAWSALSESQREGKELKKLAVRGDLGEQRGMVLLRLGMHELGYRDSAVAGVRHVQEALVVGLSGADRLVAKGILAESTPEALSHFQQALQLDPFHRGAHILCLNFNHLLGRHQETQERIRISKALYPDDLSIVYIEALEAALTGKPSQAVRVLEENRDAIKADIWTPMQKIIEHYGVLVERCSIEPVMEARERSLKPEESLLAIERWVAGEEIRVSHYPSFQNGLLRAASAISAIKAPLLFDVDAALEAIRASWRAHPESIIPVGAALALEVHRPSGREFPATFLTTQAELFQMGVDSSSVIPDLWRVALYCATETQTELAKREHSEAQQAADLARANIRRAAGLADLTVAECRAYFRMAFDLRALESARELLDRWEALEPEDRLALKSRVDVELATGSYVAALRLVDRWLVDAPADPWGLERRETAVAKLKAALRSTHEKNNVTN